MKTNFLAKLITIIFLTLTPIINLLANDRLAGPIDFIESPTSRATGGLFTIDTDYAMSPTYYKEIDDLGYEEIPDMVYENWLQYIEKQKLTSEKNRTLLLNEIK